MMQPFRTISSLYIILFFVDDCFVLQSALTCLIWPADHAIVFGLAEGKVVYMSLKFRHSYCLCVVFLHCVFNTALHNMSLPWPPRRSG